MAYIKCLKIKNQMIKMDYVTMLEPGILITNKS